MENINPIRILVLVDCQNDFIDGSLANKDAQNCIPRILDKIKKFNGDAIILTMDTHSTNYLQTSEGKKLPVEHCIYGTKGWQINSEIMNAVEAKRITGTSVSIVHKSTFASLVASSVSPITSRCTLPERILEFQTQNDIKPMDIEVCGFCTDICVISNVLALKGVTYDFAEITVDSKCCAGVTPEKHEAALEVMRSCQINVI
jgi:nicotinamidase-related amidase